MPTMNYYFLQHPDALQHEITTGDVVVMAITAVAILGISAIIFRICMRYL